MMVFLFWALGIALIIAQTTLLDYLPLWLGCPDLIFILVAYISYRFAWIPGIFLVFALSWVMDVVGSIYLGVYPLMCLLVFAALKALTSKSPVKESTYQIPLVGLSYLLMQIVFYFIVTVFLPDMLPEWSWTGASQRTILIVLTSIPLFVLFNRLYEYVLKRRLRGKLPRRRTRRAI